MVSALEGFDCIGWLAPVRRGGNFLEAKLDVYTQFPRVTFNYPKAGVRGFITQTIILQEKKL